jgi:plastocyanin
MALRKFCYCAMFLSLLFVFACGGGKEESAPTPAASAPSAPAGGNAFDASKATATVSGKITLDGAKPNLATLQMSADPYCKTQHTTPVQEQTVEVNADGTLKNVLVHVTQGAEKWTYATPTEAVEFDQQGCLYHPHVLAFMQGQTLKIKNSDSTLHNIHAMASKNTEFNKGMPTKGMEITEVFNTPEIIPVKCDVHRWMNAYWGVMSNPFFSVTGDNGTYSIKLPAGTYTIEAWHEKYGTQTQQVTVKDGETKDLAFTFKAT